MAQIWSYLPLSAAESLIHDFLTSRLDCYNGTVYSPSAELLN